MEGNSQLKKLKDADPPMPPQIYKILLLLWPSDVMSNACMFLS